MRAILSAICVSLLGLTLGCNGGTESSPKVDMPVVPVVVKSEVPPPPEPPVICGTIECIEDWLLDTPCYNYGAVRSDLVITAAASPYTIADHFLIDGCKPPYDFEQNWVAIIGDSITNRPVVRLVGMPTYDNGLCHAQLHVLQNMTEEHHSLFKDVIFELNSIMGSAYGVVASIQFEATSTDFVNVDFLGAGTVHFLAPLELSMDGVVLGANCDIVIGRSGWCGEESCSGPGPSAPHDGASITNSYLAGTLEFDVQAAGTANTMYIAENSLLASLKLNAATPMYPVVELTNNVLGSAPGARVIIAGNYEVVAAGNTTSKGPSYIEALADFDTTNANSANALSLTSWVYDGVSYNTAIDISDVAISHDAGACTKTITWTTNVPSSSTVYFGSSCGSLGLTAVGADGVTEHSVTVDISGMTGTFAYRVESMAGSDRRITKCFSTSVGRCYQLP